MPTEMADRIDQARGDVPFETWARGCFERTLVANGLLGPQNATVRGSRAAKTGVTPITKNKK